MDLSAHIRGHALKIPGKQQLILTAFAKALEIIPRQICDNAGLDSTNILNALRKAHAGRSSSASRNPPQQVWAGIDVDGEAVRDNMAAFVWEPALVKINAISSAAEAACLILSVDETVRNPQSEQVSASFSVAMILWEGFALILILATSWAAGLPSSGTTSDALTGSGREEILRSELNKIVLPPSHTVANLNTRCICATFGHRNIIS